MNMMNGWLILSIVALLFLSMYVYAYISVYLDRRNAKKRKQEELRALKLKEEEKRQKEQIREEKYQKLRNRSAEIKRELQRLEQMKKASASAQ